uniref:Zinc finger protein n=1 Tax=Syphacia muris TaxID=451379 RepID=A0A0N5ASE8_9BILA
MICFNYYILCCFILLCIYFISFVCMTCFFSHLQKSQSKDSLTTQLPIPARKMAKPDSYKTVMCKGWLEMGGCSFGENCRFAHGEEELRIPIDNPKYKTKLCDKYTKTGVCPYGDRCLFIHPKALDSGGLASNPYIHPDRVIKLSRIMVIM